MSDRNTWDCVPLRDLCDVRQNKREAKARLADDALVSFVPMDALGIRTTSVAGEQSRPLTEVYSGYTYFADGDVLLAKITPCFQNGKLGIARGLTNGIGFGSSEFFVLRCDERLLPEYLFHYLSRDEFIEGGVASMGGAVGHQRVPPEYVLNQRIPLPPLSEQRRLVGLLDAAFAGLATATAHTQQTLQNARELFETQLELALQNASNSSTQRLGCVVTRLTNGYVGPTRSIYKDEGVPYLLAKHVRNNRLQFDGVTYVTREFNDKHKKSKLKAGDVLLVQSGHIGHSAVVTEEHDGHNCHAMIVISPVDGLNGDFLSLCFNSRAMQERFRAIRSGSTVPHLTCKAVKELAIPVPAIDQQRQIVATMKVARDRTDTIDALATHKLGALEELKQSILHRAFRGEMPHIRSAVHDVEEIDV